ncbi:hypothetical protein MesoLj113a_67200 [Mesorhizobium sp. 113-1-2]|uniref:hypothetical protein n=1 Tax=Mesorhizobium sp. 113-1-2 TaxID=2744515 RepID=UPI000819940A|nr:hypothetical protein [Mesorhizobium sp. 113-1-2]BAV50752.1 Uncharacterized protein MLTONO_5850 [Mesorhizobium loti]BCG75562.1 hypothetical protein MesoLj113a_67200 [Mesorhizobium sp. 113-1-2]
MLYWRTQQDSRNYAILSDWGNDYGPQDFLGMEGARDIDQSKLQFRFDKQRPLPIGDFVATSIRSGFFARREVFELFGAIILQSRHKFYAAKTDKYDIEIYVPMDEVDGFDFLTSSYEKYDDGSISRIFELKLKNGFSTELDIFRMNDPVVARFDIIVSDNFKNIYDSNKLTGLRFAAA